MSSATKRIPKKKNVIASDDEGDAPMEEVAPKKGGGDSSSKPWGGENPDGRVHLKILVPNAAAGSIMGKGGETIAELQKDSGARIKLSKSNDYYPGTRERICLITGQKDGVSKILTFVIEKVREKTGLAEREKKIYILMPNSTAGRIIGYKGEFIKKLTEESGASVRLSKQAKETILAERIAIVTGDPEKISKAMDMIMDIIRDDPQSNTCLNISYADHVGLVANPNPYEYPYGHNTMAGGSSMSSVGNMNPMMRGSRSGGMDRSSSRGSSYDMPLSATGGGSGGTGLNLNFCFNRSRAPTDAALMGQYLKQTAGTLRASGYSDRETEEVTESLYRLASLGVIVLDLGGPSPSEDRVAAAAARAVAAAVGSNPALAAAVGQAAGQRAGMNSDQGFMGRDYSQEPRRKARRENFDDPDYVGVGIGGYY